MFFLRGMRRDFLVVIMGDISGLDLIVVWLGFVFVVNLVYVIIVFL